MRNHGIPPAAGEPVYLARNDQALKRHPAYRAAKAGDPAAAVQLVGDVAAPLLEQVRKFGSDVIYVAPHAVEATGENAIPQTLAAFLAQATGANSDVEIVQDNRVFHTGANAMERLIAPSRFSGTVEVGRRYVLVDDVTTLGGTLADLASYIQANGGEVVGAAVMVNAARSGRILPSAKILAMLERRYGDEIRSTFGIEPRALTAEEASYLVGFRNAEELRDRAVKARKARIGRLRAKGICLEEAQGSVN